MLLSRGNMTKLLANRGAPQALGTAGTRIRDRHVANRWFTLSAVGLLGLALVACGGESATSDDDSASGDSGGTGGSDDTGNADGAGGTQASNGNGSGGSSSGGNGSDGVTSTVGSTGFGSPGPVTSGTTSGDGAGGNSGSTDTTSGSSGGSAGAAGAPACEPQDVTVEGNCDAAFGVFFLGNSCAWISGCSCVGSDCANRYEDEASCKAAHPGCFADDCDPQDITLVGGCEPASVYVFNGVECVAMDGCSCVGEDCGESYASPEDCKAANAVCADRAHSCDDIESLYDDYVSHTACQDDSDCVMVWGQCGIGIGGCYHVVNRRWGQDGLDAIAEDWNTRDCGGAVCDCATPPETVFCDDGVCAFQE